jgi:hypothetical protein
MQQAGVQLGHERLDLKNSVGTVSSFHVGTGYTGIEKCETIVTNVHDFAHVWHQVRHPINQISSFFRSSLEMHNFFMKTLYPLQSPPFYELPRLEDVRKAPQYEDRIRYNMWLWVHWNKHIEQFAEYRYHIEDLEIEWPNMQKRMKAFEPSISLPSFSSIRQRGVEKRRAEHSWRNRYYKEPLTWGRLYEIDGELANEVWLLAERYGYDIESV